MKLFKMRLIVLSRLVIFIFCCISFSGKVRATSVYNSTPPKGLSKAWYDYSALKKSHKKYNSVYEKAKLKSTTLEFFTSSKACEEQKEFNSCDLWWCIAWSKKNYSSQTFEIIARALKKKCEDPQISGEFNTVVESLRKGREQCLSEYHRTRRIGVIGYTCEGLLD